MFRTREISPTAQAESGLTRHLKDAAAIAGGAAVGYGLGMGAAEVSMAWGRFMTQNSSPLAPEITEVIKEAIRTSWSVTGAIGGHIARQYYPEIRGFVSSLRSRD